ncbi:keratin, type I cytoskeletal 9-like [Macrosteles quadrilineatus]|uniref:keratin, type I cytoskeletal 9-like n=1 Tax=Macrosteles quadrilineatus TaxID=74068 RepID=UPI0023E15395|nr:keratin, type I cytoskeletal 9-like isoform X2 [Macrosteles quadrilineatus]XP_054274678.1 keratin, type I cytoskeletal 9-like [Macrosteles quadrilineatus]
MASKVLVKMPAVSFNQVSKKCNGSGGGEVVVGRGEGLLLPSMSNDPLLHITQLEQNIRWLHEQHQIMLSSLHQEVEVLRQRNRDLQFQLVFSKGGISISHSGSDSSPDDKNKIILSPKDCNTRTLQVEMLEKEVTELKAALAETTATNVSLNNVIEQQKKQLMAKESRLVEADYEAKLDDAERLIRRLRRDNEEQRKEISALRAAVNKSGGSGHGQGGSSNGGGRSGRRGGHEQHRFPPLHSQSYWHHSQQRSKTSPDYSTQPSSGGSGRRGGGGEGPSLPHLSRNYSQPSGSNGNRSRYYSNGNHYYKYHGGRGNRDPSQ